MPGGDRYRPAAPPVSLIVLDVNNIGLCLNTGIAAARGKYYVQLDSDDRLKPDAVEKLLSVFESDPAIGMVIGSYEVWTLDEQTGGSRACRNPVVTHDEWTATTAATTSCASTAAPPRAAHQAHPGTRRVRPERRAHSRNYGGLTWCSPERALRHRPRLGTDL